MISTHNRWARGLIPLVGLALMSTFAATTGTVAQAVPAADTARPRVLVLTDAEIDDRSTMVRFLMYSSDFDVEGIIEGNSRWQQNGHSVENWWEDELAAYAQVYPNLIVHNPNYPTPQYLDSVTKIGNENRFDLTRAPQDMATKDTEGEKLIIDVLLKDDPRPILATCWGGCNTLAQAIWTISQTQPKAVLDQALAKIRLYVIWYQDNGGRWIEENYPAVTIFEAYQWDDIWDYQATTGPAPNYIHDIMTTAWLNTNVKQNHGPLGAYTPQNYISEGDTPSFMGAVANGLADGADDFSLGGWGGRAALDFPYVKPNHYTDWSGVADDGDAYKQYWRWLPAAQADFAARMDWCVTPNYADANHAPVAVASGDTRIVAQPGQRVTLDLAQSSDPDGDGLSFNFWQYADADPALSVIDIANAGTSRASFVVPNEPGSQLQVIGEVHDDGSPSLVTYKRYLIDIGWAYTRPVATPSADAITWSAPQAITDETDVATTGHPVRALNLTNTGNTAALTVGGVAFTAAPRPTPTNWPIPGTDRTGRILNLPGGDTITYAEGADNSSQSGAANGISPAGITGSYQALLDTAYFNSATETGTGTIGGSTVPVSQNERSWQHLTLNNLIPGVKYQVQFWASDGRIDNLNVTNTAGFTNPDLTTIVRDQGGDMVLQHNLANLAGSGGQYAIGSFTASSSSKVIDLIGGPGAGRSDNRTALVNAYQLRELPKLDATASVVKLKGNTNQLTITVTESYSDGTTVSATETFTIANNAADSYAVGGHQVWVDTKGNDQIRRIDVVG